MKTLVVRVIAFLAYVTGLDSLFYYLNRNAKRIITFHNILTDDLFREGMANGVSCNLSSFLKIIKECRKRFPVSNDLFDPKTLTITFDDGYLNQYTVAFKVLKGQNLPAYVFVSDMGEEELLVDKLLHWVAEAPIGLIPGGNRRRYWGSEIWPRFVADFERMGRTVLEELDKAYPYAKIRSSLPVAYCRERLTRIPDECLDEMRNAGWAVGWHTVSHYPLSRLSEDILKKELDSPNEFRNVCLSYPYGNPVEVGSGTVRMAEAFGYPCAVSNTNTDPANKSSFFLPRMSLPANKYRLHFRLSGLEHLIKYGHLLPIIEKTK